MNWLNKLAASKTNSDGIPVINYLPAFEDANKRLVSSGPNEVEKARIPVENIQAPLMVVAMEDDQMWISPKALEEIQKIRKVKNPLLYNQSDVYYLAPEAGHYSAIPGTPTVESMQLTIPGSYLDKFGDDGKIILGKSIWVLGGNPRANHLCNLNVYTKIVSFLSAAFGEKIAPMSLEE